MIADATGNLYGTTFFGGPSGLGTVFTLPAGSSTITTLAAFDGTNGSYPQGNNFGGVQAGLVADGSGNLYGTTAFGGDYDQGTVYELAAGSGTITTLVSFDGTNGASPVAGPAIDSSGNLFGTTTAGDNVGTVFEVATGTHDLSTLAVFDGTNGGVPTFNLSTDSSGNLYGTTVGGRGFTPTVFEVSADTHALTTLYTFSGTDSTTGVVVDAAGNLYFGAGGGFATGTIFELSADHTLSTLATFDVGYPTSLNADGQGNFYGAMSLGRGGGGIFELVHVPEPSTLVLASLGAAMLLATWARRRGFLGARSVENTR